MPRTGSRRPHRPRRAPGRGGVGAVLLVALLGCRARPSPEREPDPLPAQPQPRAAPIRPAASLDDTLQEITAPRLRAHVEYLAGDAMRGRPTPSPQLDEAARYLAQTFADAGLDPASPGRYTDRFPCDGDSGLASNVAAVIAGTSDEVVLVSAHYDHIGTADEGDDVVFNGANDNASGVAAMLAIARALGRAPTRPRRTLLFLGFCGEERGLQGSEHYAAEPLRPLERTVAMVNLEMLGRPAPDTRSQAWVTGHSLSDLPEVLTGAGIVEAVTFVPGTAIGPVEGNAFHRSDNYPLARRGIVAHTIAAGPLDEHYHAVTDEAERLDYDAMVPIVRAIARATWDLANSEAVPQWTAAGHEAMRR